MKDLKGEDRRHVWYYPKFKKTFNQLTEVERNEVRQQGNKIKQELHSHLQHLL